MSSRIGNNNVGNQRTSSFECNLCKHECFLNQEQPNIFDCSCDSCGPSLYHKNCLTKFLNIHPSEKVIKSGFQCPKGCNVCSGRIFKTQNLQSSSSDSRLNGFWRKIQDVVVVPKQQLQQQQKQQQRSGDVSWGRGEQGVVAVVQQKQKNQLLQNSSQQGYKQQQYQVRQYNERDRVISMKNQRRIGYMGRSEGGGFIRKSVFNVTTTGKFESEDVSSEDDSDEKDVTIRSEDSIGTAIKGQQSPPVHQPKKHDHIILIENAWTSRSHLSSSLEDHKPQQPPPLSSDEAFPPPAVTRSSLDAPKPPQTSPYIPPPPPLAQTSSLPSNPQQLQGRIFKRNQIQQQQQQQLQQQQQQYQPIKQILRRPQPQGGLVPSAPAPTPIMKAADAPFQKREQPLQLLRQNSVGVISYGGAHPVRIQAPPPPQQVSQYVTMQPQNVQFKQLPVPAPGPGPTPAPAPAPATAYFQGQFLSSSSQMQTRPINIQNQFQVQQPVNGAPQQGNISCSNGSFNSNMGVGGQVTQQKVEQPSLQPGYVYQNRSFVVSNNSSGNKNNINRSNSNPFIECMDIITIHRLQLALKALMNIGYDIQAARAAVQIFGENIQGALNWLQNRSGPLTGKESSAIVIDWELSRMFELVQNGAQVEQVVNAVKTTNGDVLAASEMLFPQIYLENQAQRQGQGQAFHQSQSQGQGQQQLPLAQKQPPQPMQGLGPRAVFNQGQGQAQTLPPNFYQPELIQSVPAYPPYYERGLELGGDHEESNCQENGLDCLCLSDSSMKSPLDVNASVTSDDSFSEQNNQAKGSRFINFFRRQNELLSAGSQQLLTQQIQENENLNQQDRFVHFMHFNRNRFESGFGDQVRAPNPKIDQYGLPDSLYDDCEFVNGKGSDVISRVANSVID